MSDTHAATTAMILAELEAGATGIGGARPSGTRFDQLGIDSFDLITLRSALERRLGRAVPDSVWLGFDSLDDIARFYDAADAAVAHPAPLDTDDAARHIRVNMPQMAVGGLSESWLFKELGDIHWQGLCDGLGTPSHAIADAAGNRLYATFIRFRWEGSHALKSVEENESLRLGSRICRYGKGMFFSDISLAGRNKSGRARLASAFTSRSGDDNKSLLKGEPAIPDACPITVLETLPPFAAEYGQLRKGLAPGIDLGGRRLCLTGDVLAEIDYVLNPYQDINGVNLLYFAAYPGISDICERQYAHRNRDRLGLSSDWALQTSTIARDISYFGNCAIDDTLTYRLHAFTGAPGGEAGIVASLSRKSDGQRLCVIFTVKTWQA